MRRAGEFYGGVGSFLRGTLWITFEQRGACQDQGLSLCLGLRAHATIKTDPSTEVLQARFMTRQHTGVTHKHRGREERR